MQQFGRQAQQQLDSELEQLAKGIEPMAEPLDPMLAALPLVIAADGVSVPFRRQRNFEGENFWARGEAVSTVGCELEAVRR